MKRQMSKLLKWAVILLLVSTQVNWGFTAESADKNLKTANEAAFLTNNDLKSYDFLGYSLSMTDEWAVIGAYGHDFRGGNSGAVYVYKYQSNQWIFFTKLTANDGQTGDRFGLSVSIFDQKIMVGAPGAVSDMNYAQGAVYEFNFNPAVNTWFQSEKIRISEPGKDIFFGATISLYGSSMVVGAPDADDGGSYSGSVYVFNETGSQWNQHQKLNAFDAAANARFGSSVSLNDNFIAIGAPKAQAATSALTGAVYVYEKVNDNWVNQNKLSPASLNHLDHFGTSLDLHQNRLAINARNNDFAYIFDYSGGNWSAPDTLLIGDAGTSSSGAHFNRNIKVVADKVLVGSPLGSNGGSALLFEKSGGSWSLTQSLTSNDIQTDDNFGTAVGMTADKILIGADKEDDNVLLNNNGAVYSFKDSGASWFQANKLNANDSEANDGFGKSVSIDGEYAVVGAPNHSGYGASAGAAYVYKFIDLDWKLIAKLSTNDLESGDEFGTAVTLSGDRIMVGAHKDDDAGTDAGAVYVFNKSNESWVLTNKLVGNDTTSNDGFGAAVSLSGDKVVIGAEFDDLDTDNNAGSAYIFEWNTAENIFWEQTAKIVANDSTAFQQFGHSVSISADRVLIGAIRDSTNGFDSGAAYIFDYQGSTWTQSAKLLPLDGIDNDSFGTSVSLDNDQALIGAPFDDDNSQSNSGSAYIFETNGSEWQQKDKITATNGLANDRFGSAVAINGDSAVIGAHLADGSGLNKGSVYQFAKSNNNWSEIAALVGSNVSDDDNFGYAVDLNSRWFISGSRLGSQAYVFNLSQDPLAVTDTFTFTEDASPQTLNVKANDNDADGGYYQITNITQPANGTANIQGDTIVYQPNPNYCNDNGLNTDNFNYTLNGGSTAEVQVTVQCVDDLGTAFDDQITIQEDSNNAIVDVLANDVDIDGGSVIVAVTNPSHGTTSLSGQSIYYGPNPDYCNDDTQIFDTFSYELNGGSTAEVSVEVVCTGANPVAMNDTYTQDEDDQSYQPLNVLSNDQDDGAPLSITNFTQPQNGTVAFGNANLVLTYIPDANYCNTNQATDDFTYTINNLSTTTVSMIVNCLDDFATAVDDQYTIDEDTDSVFDVIANDTDEDGGSNSIISFTRPSHGNVTLRNNIFTYSPNQNYCNESGSPDQFSYTLRGNSTADVYITVSCINDQPVARDDVFTVTEDIATILDIHSNDLDIDNLGYNAQFLTLPQNGSIDTNGTIYTYTPNQNFCHSSGLTDEFTYQVNGGDTALIAITIECVDDAPVAMDDFYVIDEDTSGVFNDVLDNDDIDGGQNKVIGVTQPQHGVASMGTRQVSYQPNHNYCTPTNGAPDTFTYTITGGTSATVSVTTNCINDAPQAVEDNITINEDEVSVLDVLANDTDVEGDDIEIIEITIEPNFGSVVNNQTSLTYHPDLNYCNSDNNSTDFLAYRLNGGSTAWVGITIECIDDPLQANDDTFTLREDSNDVILNLTLNDIDPDTPNVMSQDIISVTQPNNGTVSIYNNLNSVRYKPNPDYCSQDSLTDNFNYTLEEGETAEVRMTVTCVNDQPNFSHLGNQIVYTQDAYQIANWAYNIDFGAENENNSQQVERFIVSIDSDSNSTLASVNIDQAGTLSFETTGEIGAALLSMIMEDNGGVDNGGVNQSVIKTFSIVSSDLLFANGFEQNSQALKTEQFIESLQVQNKPELIAPKYNKNQYRVDYFDYSWSLYNHSMSPVFQQCYNLWKNEIEFLYDIQSLY